MRVNLAPIIPEARALLSAIEAKQRGPARDASHRLMCALPLPCWADPAPGMTILYGDEPELHEIIESIRRSTIHWMMWLNECVHPTSEWPSPMRLREATHELEEYTVQNASVS